MLCEVAGYIALRTTRGRANQMNAGASQASGDVLLFLHADTRLPQGAARHIEQALADKEHCWGRFDVCITGRPFMLRVVSRLMNWRSRLTGIATGDQAIFLRRDVFEHLRGFPDQPLMEDVELSKRLLAFSRPACIKHYCLCQSPAARFRQDTPDPGTGGRGCGRTGAADVVQHFVQSTGR